MNKIIYSLLVSLIILQQIHAERSFVSRQLRINNITEIYSKENLLSEVEKNADTVMVVGFCAYRHWPICNHMYQTLERMIEEYYYSAKIYIFDMSQEYDQRYFPMNQQIVKLKQDYQLEEYPTVLYFKNKELVYKDDKVNVYQFGYRLDMILYP